MIAREAPAQINPHRTGKVAISNQKGGVAKTTTALSLGASLAETGVDVLLVDLDPQAHLTQALGFDLINMRHTIGDVLLNQGTLTEVSRETRVPNLDLVPADRGLILVERMLQNTKAYEYRLKSNMEMIEGLYYDIVIFDCPPSFGPITINALTAADLVIIPAICDYFSTQSLRIYLNLLKTVRRNSNPDIDFRLLVTLFDKRLRLSKMVLEQYRQSYGSILFETIIPIDAKLRESPVFGRPITEYATRARSADGYCSLAMELKTCLKMTT